MNKVIHRDALVEAVKHANYREIHVRGRSAERGGEREREVEQI